MEVSRRSGCRVGWVTYDNEAEAKEVAEANREQGRKMAREGYDFGFQTPGQLDVHEKEDGTTLYTVTTT